MLHKQAYIILSCGLLSYSIAHANQFNSSEYAQKKAMEQGIAIGGKQVNDAIDHLKESWSILTPSERLKKEYDEAQLELAKQNKALLDLQIKEAELNLLIKQTEAAKAILPGNDRVSEFERLKQEYIKQNGTPLKTEGTPSDIKQTEVPSNKSTDEIKVKTGLFAAISASCVTAANKAGICADFFAGYSFAHITKLNCFKETFIGKHSVGINRTLVAATLVATTYAAYRIYKSKTNSADDDDIFNDDNMYEF